MKPMRYAHNDGHTDLCYDDSGRYILTCGTDGDVRIWEGIEDDDAVSHRVGDRAFAIAFKKDRFFTATDTNSVQASKFPDGMPDGLVTRFTAPVNHMAFNAAGSFMVAGSSDFTVKVVDVESSSHKVYRGHKAPVLSVALDPKEQFVASSSCDGSVQVWSVDDQSEVKTLQVLDKCSDVSLSKSLCRLCWTPNGEYLLVPVAMEIHVYARENWELMDKISHADITGTINILGLSCDGRHVAAGCVDGVIGIIDWQKRKLVEKRRHEKGLTITALAWNPANSHHIAFCDKEGQLGLLEDLLVSAQGSAAESSTVIPGMEGVFDDDDDMLMQASSKAVEDGDDVDDDDDDADSIDLGAIKKSMMPLIMGDEDSNAADSVTGTKADGTEETARPLPVAPVVVEGFKPTPMQKPFQPGSTPQHLSSRFMKWNSVGIIRQYNTEDESSIDIEFHDTATHHAMHITNTSDYTMADLTTEAVVLATASDEELNSKLTCMHFGSWDSAKEWNLTMPEGEIIQAVTAGEGWVAVATSSRNVRLFTVGGVQRSAFSLPGPVVCLAAHRQRLMAVYHAGMGIPGDQNLACRTLNVTGQTQRSPGDETLLPLSPKSTLSWAGFSAEGTPFTMDSEGVVRMMNTSLATTWTQVANTRDQVKGKSDHYWIVGINENPQQLRCIPCKGSRYPAILPRPAVTVLPFCLSLCEQDSEKSQYEEQFMRTVLFAQHLSQLAAEGYGLDEASRANLQRPAQEALMKLFALSVRSEREFRAMEVCDMMLDEQTLQLSIKYATRQRHLQLAQRISQLAQLRAEERQEEEEGGEEDGEEFRENPQTRSETEWVAKSSLGSRKEEEETEEEDMEEEEKKSSGPTLNIKPKDKLVKKQSSGRENPFRVSSQEKEAGGTKGTQIFDSMKKTKERTAVISPLPVSVRQTKGGQRKIAVKGKQPQQPKIAFSTGSETSPASKVTTSQAAEAEQSENEPTKRPVSAFELWLAESQEDLQEEHPELSQEELSRIAAEKFRTLSREERQVWLQKAKTQTPTDSGDSDKKRKRTEEEKEDNTPPKSQKTKPSSPAKKPLSQSTNSKLAGFAFSSKP